jgi:hypothetical protein
MSARATPAGFVWCTFWRKAREAAHGLEHGRRDLAVSSTRREQLLARVVALEGLGPVAVACWRAREHGEGAWPRLDVLLFKAWVLAGRPGTWPAFKRDMPARAAAMQRLAAARRREART